MTPLEAFKQAQETGQIAISKTTASAMTHILAIEAHYNDLIEDLTKPYCKEDHDGIAAPIHDLYYPLMEAIEKQLLDTVRSEGLGVLDFKGL